MPEPRRVHPAGVVGYLLGSLALALPLLFGGRRLLRSGPTLLRRSAGLASLLAAAVVLGFAGRVGWIFAEGPPAPLVEAWAPGVTHARVVTDRPGEGPVVLHAVEVDLPVARPAFSLWPTPLTAGGTDFEDRVGRLRVTTGAEALAATGADLVLNASHFGPIYGDLVFWSYPRRGDPVLPMGSLAHGGDAFGVPQPHWPWVRLGPSVAIDAGSPGSAADAADASAAVAFAGRSVLVSGGRPTPRGGHLAGDRYPRCALGLDAAGETLFLVVVDGKHPRRSVGLTLAALADRLVEMGVHDAVELDGGGSAQLTRRLPGGTPVVVNRPSHQKIPGTQRPVGNHLAVRFAG